MNPHALRWGAIVVAAGRGTRFGKPKQLIDIAGSPMLSWPLRTLQRLPEICDVIVVTEAEWLQQIAAVASDCAVVPGGATRRESVHCGLRALPARCEAVLVHDGARPLIAEEDVRRGMEPVRSGHASLLGIPLVDTVKVVDSSSGLVVQTLERHSLWAAQTPQFATIDDMRRAHESAVRELFEATDDAMLLERIGIEVHMIQGSPENFKVTLPQDQARAEHAMLARLAAQGAR